MYQVTCDGYPLLDCRDHDLILVNPKLRLAVNSVSEGSFTIHKNHPHYDKLLLMKSVVEVSDEYGVIFRGRATADTVDIHNGMTVDLEGVLAYFNDSIVRPFTFPDDFKDDADYKAAAASGNVVEFFLRWLIDNHNSQVKPFQRLHLGRVTVSASDNYLKRFDKEHTSTWETMKTSLFDSELGGYLCVRYEPDGNYVDFLSGFDTTNDQEVVFGENILDIINETNATETYTAIIPLGAVIEYKVQTGVTQGEFVDFINTKVIEENVNIKGLPDGNLTDDLVKSGDTIYSRIGVEQYGWIYAPANKTTWNYVEDAETLLNKAVEWLTNSSVMSHSIEVNAVDLHFTDAQVRSLRMYQNVIVYSEPHNLSKSFQIAMLEIDLLNPQKTNIYVGDVTSSLVDRNVTQQEDLKKNHAALKGADERIRLQVQDELSELTSSVDIALGEIALEVRGVADEYTRLAITLDGVTVTDPDGTTLIKGSSIETDSLVLTGKISWKDLDDDVQDTINSAGGISASYAKTLITSELVSSPKIAGGKFYNLSQDHWLEVGDEDGMYGLILTDYAHQDTGGIFNVCNADMGYISLGAKGGYIFLHVDGYSQLTNPLGTWNFSGANVTGLSVVFG